MEHQWQHQHQNGHTDHSDHALPSMCYPFGNKNAYFDTSLDEFMLDCLSYECPPSDSTLKSPTKKEINSYPMNKKLREMEDKKILDAAELCQRITKPMSELQLSEPADKNTLNRYSPLTNPPTASASGYFYPYTKNSAYYNSYEVPVNEPLNAGTDLFNAPNLRKSSRSQWDTPGPYMLNPDSSHFSVPDSPYPSTTSIPAPTPKNYHHSMLPPGWGPSSDIVIKRPIPRRPHDKTVPEYRRNKKYAEHQPASASTSNTQTRPGTPTPNKTKQGIRDVMTSTEELSSSLVHSATALPISSPLSRTPITDIAPELGWKAARQMLRSKPFTPPYDTNSQQDLEDLQEEASTVLSTNNLQPSGRRLPHQKPPKPPTTKKFRQTYTPGPSHAESSAGDSAFDSLDLSQYLRPNIPHSPAPATASRIQVPNGAQTPRPGTPMPSDVNPLHRVYATAEIPRQIPSPTLPTCKMNRLEILRRKLPKQWFAVTEQANLADVDKFFTPSHLKPAVSAVPTTQSFAPRSKNVESPKSTECGFAPIPVLNDCQNFHQHRESYQPTESHHELHHRESHHRLPLSDSHHRRSPLTMDNARKSPK